MGETIVELGKHSAADAAKRRFPHHGDRIDTLLEENETFREVCGELCEADAALARFSAMSASEAQVEHWRSCIRGLEAEIHAMMSRGTVVPLRGGRPSNHR